MTGDTIPEEWLVQIEKIKAADIEVKRLSYYHFRCENCVDFWPSSGSVFVPRITKSCSGALFENSLTHKKGKGADDVISFVKEILEEEDHFFRVFLEVAP